MLNKLLGSKKRSSILCNMLILIYQRSFACAKPETTKKSKWSQFIEAFFFWVIYVKSPFSWTIFGMQTHQWTFESKFYQFYSHLFTCQPWIWLTNSLKYRYIIYTHDQNKNKQKFDNMYKYWTWPTYKEPAASMTQCIKWAWSTQQFAASVFMYTKVINVSTDFRHLTQTQN